MTRTRTSFVAALLLPALVACGSNSSDGEAGDLPTSSAPAAADGGPEVTVLDAGDEPREKLRLELHEGDHAEATMTMETSVVSSIDGQSSPAITTPAVSMGMVIDVESVDEDGIITSRFGYDDVDVAGNDAQARQMEAAIQSISDLSGTIESTDTGAVLDADLDIPDDAPATMQSFLTSFEGQMQNLTVPLPREEVGPGARWTVTTEADVNGIEAQIESTYTLVELDDDQIVLDVRIEQVADDQDLDLPGVPPGSTVHLDSLTMSGSGRAVLDRGALIPRSMESTMSGATRMTIEENGTTSEMVQDMEMTVGIEPR